MNVSDVLFEEHESNSNHMLKLDNKSLGETCSRNIIPQILGTLPEANKLECF